MPQNSLYNTLRSWMLHKYPPEKVITAQDAVRIVDDLVTLMQGIQLVQDGIILPDTKGQIITHDGTQPTLQDVGTDGRIIIADSGEVNGWNWFDPSVLGFMTGLLVRLNGTGVGTRQALNFLNGGGITWTITDDGANGEVEVSGTVAAPSGSALTKADDTNVTLTLGGTPASALLAAVSLTLGWTGQLAVGRGGTGLSTLGAALQVLRVNSGAAALEYVTPYLNSKSSSDQTTATGALVDITNVGLSIAANQLIYFRAVVHVGTSANNGARYAVTIPTGATMKVMFMAETTGAIGQGPSQWITTSGAETTTVNAINNTAQNAVFEGWVQASSTAGTIQMQGRTVNAANTVTFYSGSFITGHLAN